MKSYKPKYSENEKILTINYEFIEVSKKERHSYLCDKCCFFTAESCALCNYDERDDGKKGYWIMKWK